jgi:replicative DNA helicase
MLTQSQQLSEIEAMEMALMGTLAYQPSAVNLAALTLKPDDLASLKVRAIYEAMLTLSETTDNFSRKSIIFQMRATGSLADVGEQFVGECFNAGSPESGQWKIQLEAVLEASKTRKIAALCESAIKDLQRGKGDSESIIGAIQAGIDKVRSQTIYRPVKTFTEVAVSAKSRLDRKPLASGMPELDRLVGGFHRGYTYLLVGSTGTGKSTLAIALARGLVQHSPGIIFPTELSVELWLLKLAANLIREPFEKVRDRKKGSELDKRVVAMLDHLGSEMKGCAFGDNPTPSPEDISAAIRAGSYEWVIVDSVSNARAPGKSEHIFDQTRAVAEGIQRIATRQDVCVIMTAQAKDMTDRITKDRNPIPRKGDTQGGLPLEQVSNVMVGLLNPSYWRQQGVKLDDKYENGTMYCVNTKYRDGTGTATYKSCTLAFNDSGIYSMAREE